MSGRSWVALIVGAWLVVAASACAAHSRLFVVRGKGRRTARVDAPHPLRAALEQVLAREGWTTGEFPEVVVSASEADRIAVRAAGFAASSALGALPELLRRVPAGTARCAPEAITAAVLAKTSEINGYFAVGTGPVDSGWQSVHQLYTDPGLLDGIVDRVQTRMGAAERRVAASTFFLGFAARLWSIGVGAVVGHRLLPELAAEELLFREVDGQTELHIERPVGWQGDDLEPLLADMILDAHLAPLTEALRRLAPISRELLRGNAASALLGAARVYDNHRATGSPGPGWELARRLFADERLNGTVRFSKTNYRRTSCCLYYRAPAGGLCGDCVFTHIPDTIGRKDAS
jgi:iron complex transport system ATP-binding protein